MSQPKRIHWLIAILMAIASFLIGMTVQQYFSKKHMAKQSNKMRHVLLKVSDCADLTPEEIEFIIEI